MEEYHPPGYDGATGDIGFRVKPLDPKCRELNRHCVLPIGYELNNMLITNWDPADYTNLELYDLYEQMYSMKYGEIFPYRGKRGLNIRSRSSRSRKFCRRICRLARHRSGRRPFMRNKTGLTVTDREDYMIVNSHLYLIRKWYLMRSWKTGN